MVTNGDSGNIGPNCNNDDLLEKIMIHWSYNGGNLTIAPLATMVPMVKIIPLATLEPMASLAPVVLLAPLKGDVSSTFHTCHCTLK